MADRDRTAVDKAAGVGAKSGPVPVPRQLFVDRRGAGMRVSVHAHIGVVVLSLWREDICVGTFHLEPHDAARLTAVLAKGLATMAWHEPTADVDAR